MSIKIYNDPKLQQLYNMHTKQGSGKTLDKGNTNIDQVNFSSTLQQVQQCSQSEMTDVQRTAKVASLKEQIASGEYNPDMHKVASSLLKYLIEVK
jgi:negative regulator of flagellin synthesis FlgM